jgi:preprotein translocase subunit SecF
LHVFSIISNLVIMKKTLLLIIFSSFISVVFAGYPGYSGFQSINDPKDSSQYELRIYPNPTETGRVTLEMNAGEISEIRVINITGKEVVSRIMEFGTPKYLLLLENIPSGIYFVRVKNTDNKVMVRKLVVSSN